MTPWDTPHSPAWLLLLKTPQGVMEYGLRLILEFFGLSSFEARPGAVKTVAARCCKKQKRSKRKLGLNRASMGF
jgi:hypothetical protein